MGERFSASKTDRAFACGYPFRPDVEVPEQPSSYPARFGTARHKLAEVYVGGKEPDVAAIAKANEVDAVELHDGWGPLRAWLAEHVRPLCTVWCEVPLAYDTATGTCREILESAGHRDYASLTPTEIAGTVDIMRDAPPDECGVDDIKGSQFGHTPPARENGQLATLALMAARYYGRDTVQARLIFAEPGGVTVDAVELKMGGFSGLEAHGRALADLVASFPAAQPVVGAHCEEGYCPLLATCPARVALVAREDPTLAEALAAGIQGPDDVRRYHRRLQVIEGMAEAMRGRIKDVVRECGRVDLGDGKALVATTSKARVSVDGKAAIALAESLGASPAQIADCTKIGAPSVTVREVRAA